MQKDLSQEEYKGEKVVTEKGQHGLLNVLHYAPTTFKCKRHRPAFVFEASSIIGVKSVVHALQCPKCNNFGLELVSQGDHTHSVPVYGTR